MAAHLFSLAVFAIVTLSVFGVQWALLRKQEPRGALPDQMEPIAVDSSHREIPVDDPADNPWEFRYDNPFVLLSATALGLIGMELWTYPGNPSSDQTNEIISPAPEIVPEGFKHALAVYYSVMQSDSVRMVGDSMIVGRPPRAVVVQASLQEVLQQTRQLEKEHLVEWQQHLAHVQHDPQIPSSDRQRPKELWTLYLDLKETIDVPGVFTPKKYEDLTRRYDRLFPPPTVAARTSQISASPRDEVPSEARFYEASRQPPYMANVRSLHSTRTAAIQALAQQFHRSARWVESHMGSSNRLRDIHQNLSVATLTATGTPRRGIFKSNDVISNGVVHYSLVETLKQAWQREGYRDRSRAEKLQAIALMQLAVDNDISNPADREATLDYIQREIGAW